MAWLVKHNSRNSFRGNSWRRRRSRHFWPSFFNNNLFFAITFLAINNFLLLGAFENTLFNVNIFFAETFTHQLF